MPSAGLWLSYCPLRKKRRDIREVFLVTLSFFLKSLIHPGLRARPKIVQESVAFLG